MEKIAEKDCLCEGLTSSVRLKNDMEIPHKLKAVAICPGPNLAYFSGVFSLEQMVGHIYGRYNLLNNLPRPHMFVNELVLYIDYLRKLIRDNTSEAADKQARYISKFREGLLTGLSFYRSTVANALSVPANENLLRSLEQDILEL